LDVEPHELCLLLGVDALMLNPPGFWPFLVALASEIRGSIHREFIVGCFHSSEL
jgi:hypothetical protein